MGYIYKITNKISGKMYIGETKEADVETRWRQHRNTIRNGRGCPALRDAVEKYGWDAFKFEIVVICFDENRYAMEQYYIKKYNTLAPNGYNITLGGPGGCGFLGKKHTSETVGKIKKSLAKFKEKHPNHFESYKEKHRKSMENVNTSDAVKKSEKFRKAVEEGRVGGKAHKVIKQLNNENVKTNITILKDKFKDIINKSKLINANIIKVVELASQIFNEKYNIDNIDNVNQLSHKNNKIIKKEQSRQDINTKISNSLKNYFQQTEERAKVNVETHRNIMTKAVGKKVHKIKNGSIIETYISMSDAARKNNIAKSSLMLSIKKNREFAGFQWIIASDERT